MRERSDLERSNSCIGSAPPCVRPLEWIDNVPNVAVEDDASIPVRVGLATIDDHGEPLSAKQFSGTVTAILTPDGLARLMARDAPLGRPDFTPIIVACARCAA